MSGWMDQTGPDNDVVISSRVRLARNYEDIPFPPMMNQEGAQKVIDRTKSAVLGENERENGNYRFINIKDLNSIERMVLVEKHVASPDLIRNPQIAALLVKDDEQISIMMNEEDHLRIQCLLSGFQLDKAGSMAGEIDDTIEASTKYAFDEQLGYLTCCPTNVGTGMRASVMMHLPALTMTGYIGAVLQTVAKIGLTIRGMYGEGTEVLGNIYQISNQVTLGMTEKDIIMNLIDTCKQIIEKERMVRSTLMKTSKIELEDKLCRSYGLFANARKMDSKELMKLISDVKLAVNLSIIEHIDDITLNKLIIYAQPANLQKIAGKELTSEECDVIRAELVRRTVQKQSI